MYMGLTAVVQNRELFLEPMTKSRKLCLGPNSLCREDGCMELCLVFNSWWTEGRSPELYPRWGLTASSEKRLGFNR